MQARQRTKVHGHGRPTGPSVPSHEARLRAKGHYVASVPQLPACHTQTQSLDEVVLRVREAIELCIEVEGVPVRELELVGIQRVPIAA